MSSEKCKCDNVILPFFITATIIIVDDENDTKLFYVCDDYDWTQFIVCWQKYNKRSYVLRPLVTATQIVNLLICFMQESTLVMMYDKTFGIRCIWNGHAEEVFRSDGCSIGWTESLYSYIYMADFLFLL